MREKSLNKLDQLDAKLEQLLKMLDQYDPHALLVQSVPGVWSPAQLVSHLRLAEDISVAYVKKKLSFDPKLKKVGIVHGLKSVALNLFLASPLKFGAPPGATKDDFPVPLSYSTEAEKWLKLRKEVRSYLSELDEKWFDRDVYKHPVTGRHSLGQMLDFFAAHMDRHTKQINARLPK